MVRSTYPGGSGCASVWLSKQTVAPHGRPSLPRTTTGCPAFSDLLGELPSFPPYQQLVHFKLLPCLQRRCKSAATFFAAPELAHRAALQKQISSWTEFA